MVLIMLNWFVTMTNTLEIFNHLWNIYKINTIYKISFECRKDNEVDFKKICIDKNIEREMKRNGEIDKWSHILPTSYTNKVLCLFLDTYV